MKEQIDTLVIIGNGFDVWQGMNTSYSRFQEYYLENRKRILKKLHIKEKYVIDADGKKLRFSDVELIYGDPFHPGELTEQFWGSFERSLEHINTEAINLWFGKTRSGLRQMDKSIRNAKRILTTAFCEWITSIPIPDKDLPYHFGSNCFFINFNYTATLSKLFHVDESWIFHIHGEAEDKKSIIFGHSSHPHLPENQLFRFGGRFRGLYLVDKLLYETDKHVQDNLECLCFCLALNGIKPDNIKKIVILGHSMSLPDIEYFLFLNDATRVGSLNDNDEPEPTIETDTLDDLHNRIQYTINKTGYGKSLAEIDEEAISAIERQFSKEQSVRSEIYQKDFEKMLRKHFHQPLPKETKYTPSRTQEAEWYISYYSDRDKTWVEALMKEFGRTMYTLFPTIDQCIESIVKKADATD